MKMKFAERGQALILIALAAIGLFAVAGLAIDGSAKYSDRRHAQNAADVSALTAALVKANEVMQGNTLSSDCPPVNGNAVCAAMINAAKDRAHENQYNDNKVTNTVYVYSPPQSGVYKCDPPNVHFDCHDYVQVIIDSTVNTWFARVIGINQTHNHVEAVASTISANNHFNFGGNSIVALSPTGCALKAGGNTDATINGGGLF